MGGSKLMPPRQDSVRMQRRRALQNNMLGLRADSVLLRHLRLQQLSQDAPSTTQTTTASRVRSTSLILQDESHLELGCGLPWFRGCRARNGAYNDEDEDRLPLALAAVRSLRSALAALAIRGSRLLPYRPQYIVVEGQQAQLRVHLKTRRPKRSILRTVKYATSSSSSHRTLRAAAAASAASAASAGVGAGAAANKRASIDDTSICTSVSNSTWTDPPSSAPLEPLDPAQPATPQGDPAPKVLSRRRLRFADEEPAAPGVLSEPAGLEGACDPQPPAPPPVPPRVPMPPTAAPIGGVPPIAREAPQQQPVLTEQAGVTAEQQQPQAESGQQGRAGLLVSGVGGMAGDGTAALAEPPEPSAAPLEVPLVPDQGNAGSAGAASQLPAALPTPTPQTPPLRLTGRLGQSLRSFFTTAGGSGGSNKSISAAARPAGSEGGSVRGGRVNGGAVSKQVASSLGATGQEAGVITSGGLAGATTAGTRPDGGDAGAATTAAAAAALRDSDGVVGGSSNGGAGGGVGGGGGSGAEGAGLAPPGGRPSLRSLLAVGKPQRIQVHPAKATNGGTGVSEAIAVASKVGDSRQDSPYPPLSPALVAPAPLLLPSPLPTSSSSSYPPTENPGARGGVGAAPSPRCGASPAAAAEAAQLGEARMIVHVAARRAGAAGEEEEEDVGSAVGSSRASPHPSQAAATWSPAAALALVSTSGTPLGPTAVGITAAAGGLPPPAKALSCSTLPAHSLPLGLRRRAQVASASAAVTAKGPPTLLHAQAAKAGKGSTPSQKAFWAQPVGAATGKGSPWLLGGSNGAGIADGSTSGAGSSARDSSSIPLAGHDDAVSVRSSNLVQSFRRSRSFSGIPVCDETEDDAFESEAEALLEALHRRNARRRTIAISVVMPSPAAAAVVAAAATGLPGGTLSSASALPSAPPMLQTRGAGGADSAGARHGGDCSYADLSYSLQQAVTAVHATSAHRRAAAGSTSGASAAAATAAAATLRGQQIRAAPFAAAIGLLQPVASSGAAAVATTSRSPSAASGHSTTTQHQHRRHYLLGSHHVGTNGAAAAPAGPSPLKGSTEDDGGGRVSCNGYSGSSGAGHFPNTGQLRQPSLSQLGTSALGQMRGISASQVQSGDDSGPSCPRQDPVQGGTTCSHSACQTAATGDVGLALPDASCTAGAPTLPIAAGKPPLPPVPLSSDGSRVTPALNSASGRVPAVWSVLTTLSDSSDGESRSRAPSRPSALRAAASVSLPPGYHGAPPPSALPQRVMMAAAAAASAVTEASKTTGGIATDADADLPVRRGKSFTDLQTLLAQTMAARMEMTCSGPGTGPVGRDRGRVPRDYLRDIRASEQVSSQIRAAPFAAALGMLQEQQQRVGLKLLRASTTGAGAGLPNYMRALLPQQQQTSRAASPGQPAVVLMSHDHSTQAEESGGVIAPPPPPPPPPPGVSQLGWGGRVLAGPAVGAGVGRRIPEEEESGIRKNERQDDGRRFAGSSSAGGGGGGGGSGGVASGFQLPGGNGYFGA